jgi:hypothetical protein
MVALSGLKAGAQEANYYSYHPMSIMSLGGGYSPSDLTAAKLRAIEYVAKKPEGTAKTNFDTILVTSSTQLKQALQIDLQVDASYLAFSGGASFSYDQSSLFSQDTITVVMRTNSDYGLVEMEKARLTPMAEDLIKRKKMDQFEATYGSRYVVKEKRGASVSVILTVADLNSSEKTTIFASVRASGGWGPIGGSAKASFQQSLARSAQNGSQSEPHSPSPNEPAHR